MECPGGLSHGSSWDSLSSMGRRDGGVQRMELDVGSDRLALLGNSSHTAKFWASSRGICLLAQAAHGPSP